MSTTRHHIRSETNAENNAAFGRDFDFHALGESLTRERHEERRRGARDKYTIHRMSPVC